MNGFQFVVALVTALVAPLALYAQQTLQNRREERRWSAEFESQQREAARAERAQRVDELRDVYQSLLQAAYAYRAERSVWAARARIGIEDGSVAENEFVGQNIGTPSDSRSLPALQEAIGVARLHAPSPALLSGLLDLVSAADRAERTLTTWRAAARDARDDWAAFESRLAVVASECAAALAVAQGKERPPAEQVTTGHDPRG